MTTLYRVETSVSTYKQQSFTQGELPLAAPEFRIWRPTADRGHCRLWERNCVYRMVFFYWWEERVELVLKINTDCI